MKSDLQRPRTQGDEASRAQTETALLMARSRLGQSLRNRREELRVRVKEIATQLGWTTQFYGEVEKGIRSSDDIGAWLRLADMLQLDRTKLLEQVWSTRPGFTIALPDNGDPRRSSLLKFVVGLYAEGEQDPLFER